MASREDVELAESKYSCKAPENCKRTSSISPLFIVETTSPSLM